MKTAVLAIFHTAVFRFAAKTWYRRGSDVSCLSLQLWLQLLSNGHIHYVFPSSVVTRSMDKNGQHKNGLKILIKHHKTQELKLQYLKFHV